MQLLSIKSTLTSFTVLAFLLISETLMAYPEFTCTYERDTNPPLNPEAEKLFQRARAFEKKPGIKDWITIIKLYEQAIEMGHWKAMHNLAGLYRTGWPGLPGIEKDTGKMLDLYKRMLKLRVPLGYYNWAVVAEKGNGILKSDRMAASYMFQAAQLGSPLAQARIGQYFSFELPREKQDDDMAELYYRCAGAQENTKAIGETASFYESAKRNIPKAMFYYQRAASFGDSMSILSLKEAFEETIPGKHSYGYVANKELQDIYEKLFQESQENPSLKFPHLAQDYPLPRHPKQGYDAEHPDQRPEL